MSEREKIAEALTTLRDAVLYAERDEQCDPYGLDMGQFADEVIALLRRTEPEVGSEASTEQVRAGHIVTVSHESDAGTVVEWDDGIANGCLHIPMDHLWPQPFRCPPIFRTRTQEPNVTCPKCKAQLAARW
ncbi:MAG: hypothetical protein Q8N53_03115, partial [Longimicrobiales bacterium]|nr:hypothetical protein [Longimicrobiales bacterium]